MENFKLTDQFGIDADAQPGSTSALLKYFSRLPTLRLDAIDLSKIGGLTLDQPAIRTLGTGVSFDQPVNLGEGAPTLSFSAGSHALLSFVADVDNLPGEDRDAQPDACYVSFGVEATASADFSASAAGAQFGVSPSTRLEIASYSRFPKTATLL